MTIIRMTTTATATSTEDARPGVAASMPHASPAPVAPLLRLIWLASPALPIGAFSYSEVLEAAVDHGLVHDDASAADWLTQQLQLLARGDLALMAQAVPAWQRGDHALLAELAQWLHTTRDGAEARLQSEQMGQSLLAWLRPQQLVPEDALQWLRSLGVPSAGLPASPASGVAPIPPHYALVMALALSTIAVPLEQALQAQAFGWAENQVQAALKAVPLGQTAGQRVLARLAAEIPAAVAQAIAQPPARRQLFAPRLSILAARHETQYSRLFRS